jgi:glycosyltransferase involved in cell wall biosynthesis
LRVAVLTPTLPERSSLLNQCVASVQAQTVPVYQHLVGVDEGREGPSVTRNRLAASSDADWFLPLDDDDLLDPEFLAVLEPHLDGADVVYPWCRVEDHAELEPWAPNRLFRPDAMLRFNYVPVTALVRAELWREVGGMPIADIAEDWLMWKNCLAVGARFRCVPEVLWTYRRGLSGSRNQWAAQAA